jgi:hypothetical protein
MTTVCVDCGAEIIAGEPPHELKVHRGAQTWIEFRCRECADNLAWALWPEDFGPCPYHKRVSGRA